MACHDSDGNTTGSPDRSLGSFSLNATGEQLDDIQANLDRLYLDSPAPSSMEGSGDYHNAGIRRIGQLAQEPSIPVPKDPEAFAMLELLDLDEAFETIDSVDWLVPPRVPVPDDFDEDDRTFLDTGLLYSRYNLLNFVARVVNEEIYAESKRNRPPTSNSNLSNEAAGSGATFRVNRPPRRTLVGNRQNSDGAETGGLAQNGRGKNEGSPPTNLSAISSLEENSEGGALSAAEIKRQKYLTYRRPPVQRQQDVNLQSQESSQSVDSAADGFTVSQRSRDRLQLQYHNDRNNQGLNSTVNGDRLRRQSFNSSGSNLDDDGFIPDEISPTGPAGGCRLQGLKPGDADTPPSEEKAVLSKAPLLGLRNPFDDEPRGDNDFSPGSYSQDVDSRTYTRPKKTRMSLGTPNRQLNTTMSFSPMEAGSRKERERTPQRQINTTLDLSPVAGRRPLLGSSNQLNTTVDIPVVPSESNQITNDTYHSGRHLLNTTMDMTPDRKAGGLLNSPNLNETFVAESTPDRSRRVTRNLSYVVRDDDLEQSPNNNASPQGHIHGAKSDLNNTFNYEADGDIGSPVTRGSQNTSMEDLNSRVASQIRSLGCSTISRGKIPDGIRGVGPNMEEARLVARTSSTDTYSVAHSSESPTSSGLSSPMDAQSYDDIQAGDSSSVRRSMPNLAVIRGSSTSRGQLAYPQGSGQLRKNHYISDSKLSRLGSSHDRPRLSIHSSSASNTATMYNRGGIRTPESLRTRAVDRNTSTPAALNRISSGLPTGGASRVYSAQALGSATMTRATSSKQAVGGSMGNVRSTGMAPPRYAGATASSSATSLSGLRQPRALPGAHPSTSTERLRNPTAPGIPVPTRPQSRIPAPGQMRYSRLPSKLPYKNIGNPPRPSAPAPQQRESVDDWSEGCY